MSPDMYVPVVIVLISRSKIEYKVHVKVLSMVTGKSTIAAEAVETVQLLPIYTWWESRRSQQISSTSPTYELTESPLAASPKIVQAEKKLKKGLFGKTRGTVVVSIETADSYYINIGQSETNLAHSLSIPINLRYCPISADLPPSISSLSVRLHGKTSYNVDSCRELRNAGAYTTSVTILRTSTPSTSTPLWLEDSTSSQSSFVSNLLVPMNLPSTTAKGKKVLLPSFETCLISRSYEVEIRIGFEGGSDVVLRVPASIVAKPATAAAETAFDNVVQLADNWTPPGQDLVAGEVETDLLRPTRFNLNINHSESPEPLDTESFINNPEG
jgi:hypothetical protein